MRPASGSWRVTRAWPSGPRSRSVKALSSFVAPIGRASRKSNSVPSTGSDPTGKIALVVDQHPPAGCLQHEPVDGGRPQREVGVRPGPVGAGVCADVGRRRRHGQAVVGERVVDPKRERERIAGLRVDGVLHDHSTRLALCRPPGLPARQAVDRVAERGLGERELMAVALELVASVLDAIRPRDEDLAATRGAALFDAVAVEDLVPVRPSTCGSRRRPRRSPHAGFRR